MKTLQQYLEFLKDNPIFDGFKNTADVFVQFNKEYDTDIEICFASYFLECYEGFASVLYYRKSTGLYYEVYGSHCSCYGLEDQWTSPDEEVCFPELEKRVKTQSVYDYSEFSKGFEAFQ